MATFWFRLVRVRNSNLSGNGWQTATRENIPSAPKISPPAEQDEPYMKTERLYAITIYLLNHGRTPASELAEHFEVSLRTIQRDMESLCLSGIPVISVAGAAGGYEIAERFRLDHHFATSDDYSCILTALQGLVSATGGQKARHTLEKIASVSKPEDSCLLLDFSVLREGDTALLQALQSAIAGKRMVRFVYTNNNNETRTHSVEPVAVLYRWYAWYLLAYSRVKGDYRTYKLVRMSGLEITDTPFAKEHEPAALILEKNDGADSRKYLNVLVKCSPAAVSRIKEYLNGTILRENPEEPPKNTTDEADDRSVLMELTVVENEQLWLGTLLSLGDHVEVLAPEKLRRQLLETAENIVSLYG